MDVLIVAALKAARVPITSKRSALVRQHLTSSKGRSWASHTEINHVSIHFWGLASLIRMLYNRYSRHVDP